LAIKLKIMQQLPKKAIIAVAGLGTRFLPVTKALTKEMLPIIDKPIIQYDVEELVAAGIKRIILVTRRDTRIVANHFKRDLDLERQLRAAGKKDLLKKVKRLANLASFEYLEQTKKMPYGNGTPLRIAADLVKDGPFFYLYGDDMTLSSKSVCQQLLEVYKKNRDAAAVMAAQRMPREVLYRYGVIKKKRGSRNLLDYIIEKPKAGQEPSDLVSFGRFLLTPKILPIIKKLKTGKGSELWMVDALTDLAKKEKVIVYPIQGKWLTTGDPLNYLKTMMEFVWQRKELKDELGKYIVKKLGK
jgi:UTP--glucose-1-phosphate uridylyltransferase